MVDSLASCLIVKYRSIFKLYRCPHSLGSLSCGPKPERLDLVYIQESLFLISSDKTQPSRPNFFMCLQISSL